MEDYIYLFNKFKDDIYLKYLAEMEVWNLRDIQNEIA